MDKKIEKIYSRNRIKIPKIQFFITKYSNTKKLSKKYIDKEKLRKVTSILIALTIAVIVSNMLIEAVEPVIDAQCINIAKSIATKISNEKATAVMANYSYEDLVNISKDEDGNVKMISANMITINEIISDIPILIQEELEKEDNSKFYIKLGSFTGTKLLAGRGPNVEIKMSSVGSVETDLKSEFSEAGINQTLHRIYLEVRCNVTILTPFDNIEEKIINQVLLAEGVIVGNIPSTYYNLHGIQDDNLLDVME